MDVELRRNRGRLPRSGLWVSAGLHAVVLAVLFFGSAFQPMPVAFETFQIELVASTTIPDALAPVRDELVIEVPDPSPPEPPPTIPPPPDPDPEPVPETPPPDPEPEPEPEKTPPPPAVDDPPPARADPTPPQPIPEAESAETTGAAVNVRLEGLRRDYPAYYGNIVQQILICFRPPPGNNRWRAVVYFEIREDGTVSGVRPVERSGNQSFDLAAIGAVADCAGRGRFGPLPDDLPYETLPVQFEFRPSGIGG